MARQRAPREAGFTYLGVIVLVTIIGLVGAAALKVDALLRRAAAEEELLETGAAFSAALQSYAAATPTGQPQQPRTLQDLLKDPRFPGVRRHLRKIFVDPMTGTTEWGVLYQGDHVGVLAVYSRSAARPLKLANFDTRFVGFENKEHISDWKFTANGQAVSQVAKPAVAPRVPDLPAQPAAPAPPPEKPVEQVESRDPPGTPEEPPKEPREAQDGADDPAKKPPPADGNDS